MSALDHRFTLPVVTPRAAVLWSEAGPALLTQDADPNDNGGMTNRPTNGERITEALAILATIQGVHRFPRADDLEHVEQLLRDCLAPEPDPEPEEASNDVTVGGKTFSRIFPDDRGGKRPFAFVERWATTQGQHVEVHRAFTREDAVRERQALIAAS